MAELDVERFWDRMEKLQSHFSKHRSTPAWSDATILNLSHGPLGDDDTDTTYWKSTILHQYMFGYEIPDLVMLLKTVVVKDNNDDDNDNDDDDVTKTNNNTSLELHILATKKKIAFLEPAEKYITKKKEKQHSIVFYTKNKGDNNQANYEALWKAVVGDESENGGGEEEDGGEKENKVVVVGTLLKEMESNISRGPSALVGIWERDYLQTNAAAASSDDDDDKKKKISLVDCSAGLSHVWSVKDEVELDLMKKSSVLSNKILKHGGIPQLETIINEDKPLTHEALATKIDGMIEDPSAINLKIPPDDVASCYFPIVQSGGKYDFRVSAMSSESMLRYDVICVSLGARYQNYCSTIARTFLVDAPKAVSQTYELLLGMHESCRGAMVPGKPLKHVYQAAQAFLQNERPDLVSNLPKNLGFGMGLEFRDSQYILNAKNGTLFREGMVFTLNSVLQNLELTDKEKASTPSESAIKKVDTYGLQIADMIVIRGDDGGEVMTKLKSSLSDVSYSINDDDDDDDDEEEDDDPDAKLARKLAQEEEDDANNNHQETNGRKSSRLAKHADAAQDVQEGVAVRERKQISLLKRRNEERLQELARKNNRSLGDGENDKPEEIQAFPSTKRYPDQLGPNQVKVDMEHQTVILPVFGNPVPFHISTIKNVVLPDPDNKATYLRINFYTAGMAVGKDAPLNTAKLVAKYAPYATFVREMTFRSLDPHTLTQAFRQITALRKKVRQKELREQEEANLVEQERLVRTKNERVPRLSDLTMRPVFAGRKTQGNLEAHSNGLRFISTRSEVVDIMYNNIKYAIFQPCENEIMVLIHFHLKNEIMVGKKRQLDIQFFTEVVDASQTVDQGRRSMYDPDEMDDEQRERQLRRKLNQAFRDFCKKVDAVAKRNNYTDLEFDVPYRDLGFTGNPHKEMVFIQPTLNCLVNLTETPFFCIDLADIDHCHFERVTYMSKAFDMVIVFKDFTKQPAQITMIDASEKDAIQDWLTDMELTYTQGPMNLNWKQIINTIQQDDRFYMDTEEDEVTPKEAGWDFLRMYGHDDSDDDDEDEDDSGYSDSENKVAAGGGESDDENDDDDDDAGSLDSEDEEEFYEDESEDDDDFDADEELEEQGMDWDDMEKQAMREDRSKKYSVDDDPAVARGAGNNNKRRGSSSNGQQQQHPKKQRRNVAMAMAKRDKQRRR